MKTDEWLTPPEWIAALGPFDLDPCSPVDRPWPTAVSHLTRADDGLTRSWSGRVWLNPPFGTQAGTWLAKLAAHGNGIALVPARTETRAWFESVWSMAHGVCFVRGRPHFHRIDGSRAPFNIGAPIALVAYGLPNLVHLCRAQLGHVVPVFA